MGKLFFTIILILSFTALKAQDPETIVRSIFNEALSDTTAYSNLRYLCRNTKGRLPGSPASMKAVEYTRNFLISAGADTVWLQKVTVPHWVRGKERCTVISGKPGIHGLSISALGMSVGTDQAGISARVVEVHDFDELKELGREKIDGRIVFFNRAVDNRLINTFAGYGGAVNQRISGASEASRLGAAAVIVRSATQFTDKFPHTGVTIYQEGVKKIPAVAISTLDADYLSSLLKEDDALSVRLISTCRTLPDTTAYNVIGELKGTEKPGEYITAGGHLDAWDLGEGAHDDGGGCMQAIEVLRIFKKLGIRPKRTFRAVMFMNEEISSTGGKAYAEEAGKRGEVHYAALESDRGVMAPRGFAFDAQGDRLEKLQSLAKFFSPYNIRDFDAGGGGSDIGPLKAMGALQIGYIPDIQRYFAYHHSANDTFDQVNVRELQLGSAAIASLIYLLDLTDY